MRNVLLCVLAAVSIANALPDGEVEIGKIAPEFTLPSSVGKNVSLSEFEGKIVVLEWVNHGSPFVRRKYVWEQMQKAQRSAKKKNVIWLTICSSAPDKYGHMTPDQINFIIRREKAAADYYLSDESGAVGQSYGATKTPEIFIINSDGKIAYHGAFDDDTQEPGPDEKPLPNTKNYVLQALQDLVEGMSVRTPKTDLFGSGIIYENQIQQGE